MINSKIPDAQAGSLEVNIFLPEAISNINSLGSFESDLGLKFHSCKWYEDWSESFNSSIARSFNNHGCVPEVTWQPQKNGGGVTNADVISGNYDQYIDQFAGSVKSFGAPVRISLAPEMNSQWVPWGIGVNGNTSDNHKLFWRHVVDRFRAVGASNVSWIWSPNVRYYGDTGSYSQFYPGDAYVDYAGLDGYNWGKTQSWSEWQSFSQVFSSSYNEITSISGKNVLIMEVASTEVGGDKAAWITDMFSQIRNRFTRIQGFTWFSINKETDWRIDSSKASKLAFSNAALGRSSTAPAATSPSQTSSAPSNTASSSSVNKKGSKSYKVALNDAVTSSGGTVAADSNATGSTAATSDPNINRKTPANKKLSDPAKKGVVVGIKNSQLSPIILMMLKLFALAATLVLLLILKVNKRLHQTYTIPRYYH